MKIKSLTAPNRLKPVSRKARLVQVIVETPAGCRNKFAYDEDRGIFALRKVLPAGMVFPYTFGFLPQTETADDGLDSNFNCAVGDPQEPAFRPAYAAVRNEKNGTPVLLRGRTGGKCFGRERLVAAGFAFQG